MTEVQVDWPLKRAKPESVGMCSERLGRIGELMQRYVDDGKIAGGVTLVARRGRIAHLECTGLMNIETQTPMRPDAIFRIYSMTKPVTSVAVLMLMEEGRFLLRTPAYEFLPEMADLKVAVTDEDGAEQLVEPARPVTILHLLTHTSGFDYGYVHDAASEGLTLAEFLPEQCKRPLRHQPGARWMYGASTDILGRLVEVVSGMEFDEFLRRRIYRPLGMTDTDFYVPAAKADRIAEIYAPDEDGRLAPCEAIYAHPLSEKPAFFSGGGGLLSTTSDYLRFAQMLVAGGALGDVRILGPATVELMHADHLPPGHPPVDVNQRGFGLGVSVLRDLGETHMLGSVGEFGWGGAACTQAWIDPAADIVTIIMTQLRPQGDGNGPFGLMDLFKQAAYQAIVE